MNTDRNQPVNSSDHSKRPMTRQIPVYLHDYNAASTTLGPTSVRDLAWRKIEPVED